TMEVLGAIVISTVVVVIVFAPLFTLSGMEGRLFTPLAIAYLVAIVASTVVALTVTPALSLILLPGPIRRRASSQVNSAEHAASSMAGVAGGGWVLRGLKQLASPLIRFGLHPLGMLVILIASLAAIIGSAAISLQLGRDFLPAFDEGATQVNLYSAPGT